MQHKLLAFIAVLAAANANAAVKLNDIKSPSLVYETETPNVYVQSPTLKSDIDITLTGLTAQARVTQTFQNNTDHVVHGLYVFPLPENAAIDTLLLKIGERVIEGQVHETVAAKKIFIKAKAEGKKAALLEQLRPNLFTNAVSNINPGESVTVTIGYQQSVHYQRGQVDLRFPLGITPRYSPAGSQALPSATGAGRTTLRVHLDAGFEVGMIESAYHKATIERESLRRATVTLDADALLSERDFVLRYTALPFAAPSAAAYKMNASDEEYAFIMLMPPTAAETKERAPQERIFILDTSGSMGGPAIVHAKRALEKGIARLEPGDLFNVLEFNSASFALFDAPRPATTENLREAREWVQGLRSRGGTEMMGALKMAFSQKLTDERESQVLFITDGAVSNEDALFDLITNTLGTRRLFTVGIGGAPNTHFMKKAAQFGKGTFTFIASQNEIAERLSELFAKLDAPVLKNLSVLVGGEAVEMFPREVGDLFLNEPIVLSVKAKSLAGNIVIKGERGDTRIQKTYEIAKARSNSGIDKLWARKKIETLLDEERTGQGPRKDAVVEVALKHHLVSKYTSLVAVDITPTSLGKGMEHNMSAKGPAGHLPKGGTAQTLLIFFGLAFLGMGILRFSKSTQPLRGE